MEPIRFFVAGLPVPKGSAKAFVVKGRAVVTDSAGPPLKAWAAACHGAAQTAMAGVQPLDGPLDLSLVFTLVRPKSHPKSRRTWPTTRPDLDKLVRGVLDAMTGVVFLDDGQVVALYTEKLWAGLDAPRGPGVLVAVERPPILTTHPT